MMHVKKLFLLLVYSVSYMLSSCNTTEPTVEKAELLLKLEDVSCTEAWIGLATTNLQLPITVTLKQTDPTGNSTSQILNLNTKDSLLYIDSLLPNRTYQFQSFIQSINQSSNELSITTMDTTSHSFTFETFIFGGDAGSSILYDVAIVNENSIWAVGEIYLYDSLGQLDPQPYGSAHWDGSEWKLMKVPYHDFNQTVKYPGPLFSVAYIDNNIYVVSYANLLKWTGNDWEEKAFFMEQIPFDRQVLKIWGLNQNNIYCVGRNGAIYFYFGTDWQKLEGATDVDLKDIYGTQDGKTIWISGYEDFKPTVLLKISDTMIETVFNTRDYLFVFNPDHISGEITGVWTNSNNFVYITTPYSLYRKSIYIDPSIEEALRFGDPISWLGRRSRGTDINNIFIAGSRGNVHHYNGVTLKTYQELADNGVTYYSLDVKGNLSVLCGQKFENGISDKAIITLIK